MGINFKYISYATKILDSIPFGKKETELVVFNNYTLRNRYLKEDRKRNGIFSKNCKVQTWDEFFKELFPTKKVILKENNRGITLFVSLSKETKKEIGIENFSDFVIIAQEFFEFFKDMNKSLNYKLNGLELWQEKKVKLLNKMKREYDEYLLEKNFIPIDWLENENNLNLENMSKTKKITIVDKVIFSAIEVKYIKEISKILDVEIVLQCEKGDFCEETFKLKRIEIPKNLPKIDIYEGDEDIDIGINILNDIGEENNIFTPEIESCNLEKIFPSEFKSNLKKTLNQMELYGFIEGIRDIYKGREIKLKNSIVLLNLEKYIKKSSFRLNYSIEDTDIDIFYELLKDGYKYYYPEILKLDSFYNIKRKIHYKETKIVSILNKLYEDLNDIDRFTTVEEYLDFFKNKCKIYEISLCELEFSDIIEKFSKAINLVKATENISNEINFKNLYPENVSFGILNLILDDMKGLDLVPENEEYNYRGYIKPMEEMVEYQGETVYIVDADSEKIPKIKGNYFLTEHQREKNNLITREEQRMEKKYRFFQGIFSSKGAKIYYIKSEQRGIGISPFLDELSSKKNIIIKKCPISSRDVMEIIKNNLIGSNEGNKDLCVMEKKEKNKEKWKYQKRNEDFPKLNEKIIINLGPYSYEKMKKCYFRYYLDEVLKIELRDENYDRVLSLKEIGTIVHKLLERIGQTKEKEILIDGDFNLDYNMVKKILENILLEYQCIIPIFYRDYFIEILCEVIVKNIIEFYSELKKIINKDKVVEYTSEKTKKTDKIKENFFIKEKDYLVKLIGQMDLVVETENKKIIIDYKTGEKNDTQLDFYSILLYGELENIMKGILNPLKDGKIKFSPEYKNEAIVDKKTGLPKENKNLTPLKLANDIREFMNSQSYTVAEKESNCSYCNYKKICKREDYICG